MPVLQGLKVIGLNQVVAGGAVGRLLADYGATVLKIESPSHPDILRITPPYRDGTPGLNRSDYFASFNVNELSITPNLGHPSAGKVIDRLISWADVLVENHTPGVVKRWGLDYETLRKRKPEIIMLSTSTQGQTGPFSRWAGLGFNIESLAGYYQITGWPDRLSSHLYALPSDIITPFLAASALLAAIDYRDRTGQGQYIEISQLESAIYAMSPLFAGYFANGSQPGRAGNQSPDMAPHNVYPCRGKDRWCAIAVENDAQWTSLCQVLGNPPWTKETRFAAFAGRKQDEAELDQLIAAWTVNLDAVAVMESMQGVGISAGVVQNGEDLSGDPQLRHRAQAHEIDHATMGTHTFDDWPFRLSRTPAEYRRPAPHIGEHNEFVFTRLLGYNAEQFASLLSEGLIEQ